jgi:bifunctional DNA-binding transcriptional regulator/antitoxin component of YhaV-PrlF toxin-antitoxin module
VWPRKVFKQGKSLCSVIPKEARAYLNLSSGDYLVWAVNAARQVYVKRLVPTEEEGKPSGGRKA